MKRTKYNIADAINCSVADRFTQIPNALIRNPEISSKAKTILCLLLSNRHGWKSCQENLELMMKEGRDAIRQGLLELEKFGYLKRVRYRNKIDKKFTGVSWAYTDTPFLFELKKYLPILGKYNLEPIDLSNEDHTDLTTRALETRALETHALETHALGSRARVQPARPKEQQVKAKTIPTPWKPVSGLTNGKPVDSKAGRQVEKSPKNTNKKIPIYIYKKKEVNPWQDLLEDWLDYKKERKEKLTPKGYKSFLTRLQNLSGNDTDKARLILEQSYGNNWRGIFPLIDEKSNGKPSAVTLSTGRQMSPEDAKRLFSSSHSKEIAL